MQVPPEGLLDPPVNRSASSRKICAFYVAKHKGMLLAINTGERRKKNLLKNILRGHHLATVTYAGNIC